ncbi:hypothetical protein A4X09_0g4135 [Tilletia walkeri]|uniref:Uncharacterized protein n=1 Tax=Tilletia walkeri TaxID=117179 RepID=A0A8X7T498_9BASI|nr:hypothetical protein A4X09_0g4135 [Tilletia walkeri]
MEGLVLHAPHAAVPIIGGPAEVQNTSTRSDTGMKVGSAPAVEDNTSSLTDADVEVDTDTGALTEPRPHPERAPGALGVIKWASVAEKHLPNLPLYLPRVPVGAEV